MWQKIITNSSGRHKLLQSITGITKWDKKSLQSVTGTTKYDKIRKCENYYKVRRKTSLYLKIL